MRLLTLDHAYSWLNEFDGTHLSPANQNRLRQLDNYLENETPNEAWHTLSRLVCQCDVTQDEMEGAEILVECGRAAYKFGDYILAADHLEKARVRYGWHRHQVGVVAWMLGYAYLGWRDQDARVFAIWEESMREFDYLGRNQPMLRERSIWYGARLVEMRQTLRCYQDKDCIARWSPRPG